MAQQFEAAAEGIAEMLHEVTRCRNNLQGEWIGLGSESFFGEMGDEVLPTVLRLEQALAGAGGVTRTISRTISAAEEEAAALFNERGEPFGVGAADEGGGGGGQPLDPSSGGGGGGGGSAGFGSNFVDPGFEGVANTDKVVYAPINGKPFVLAPHPNDVMQGGLGDCYFLAALATIAQQDPNTIRRMIKDHGNGTYTVTFYEDGVPVEITVDNDFPTHNGNPHFAKVGDQVGNVNELWVMIAEKAYAQWQGGYANIEGGWPHDAMKQITGVESEVLSPDKVTIEELAQYHDQGYAMSISTEYDRKFEIFGHTLWDFEDVTEGPLFQDGGGDLVASHAFIVTGVDTQAGTLTLRNPWGWDRHGVITVTMEEFQEAFRKVSLNPINNQGEG